MKNKNPQITFLAIMTGLVFLGYIISLVTRNLTYAVAIPLVIGITIMAISLRIRRASYFSYRANVAFDAKQYDIALAYYKKATEVPDCPPLIKVIYAYRLLTLGKLAEAKNIMEQIEVSALDENAKFNYDATAALITWKDGNLKKAILAYEKLLNTRESELVYETLGFLLVCNEEYDKAIELCNKAHKLYPNSLVIRDNLATAYFYTYEDKKARKLYKELIDQYVNFPEPYYYYGRIAYDDEKYKLALKYLNIALEKPASYLSHLQSEFIQELIYEVEEALANFTKQNETQNEIEVVDIARVISNDDDFDNDDDEHDDEFDSDEDEHDDDDFDDDDFDNDDDFDDDDFDDDDFDDDKDFDDDDFDDDDFDDEDFDDKQPKSVLKKVK